MCWALMGPASDLRLSTACVRTASCGTRPGDGFSNALFEGLGHSLCKATAASPRQRDGTRATSTLWPWARLND